MEPAKGEEDKPAEATPVQAFGVPRRYGVGTLLVATAMYAVFFSALRYFEVSLLEFLAVTAFVTCVGLAQPLLFKGKEPLLASVVAGAVLPVLLLVGDSAVSVLGALLTGGWHGVRPGMVMSLLLVVPAVFFGGVLGFWIGLIVGCVFYTTQQIGESLARRSERDG